MLVPYGELAAARQNPGNFPVQLRGAAAHFAVSIVVGAILGLVAPEVDPIVAGAILGLVAPEARYTGHMEVATAQAALVGTTPAVLPPTAWRPSEVHLTFDQLEQGSQLHYLEHL